MFDDKVLEQFTPNGVNPYALGGAIGAWVTWRSKFATGATGFYYATNQAGTKWEWGFGTLTYGAPDTLSRNLIASSSGSLISWVAGDALDGPVVVYSAPSGVALAHLISGGLLATRPSWAQAGLGWIDYTLGLATAWVKKRWNGTADMEEGRYYVTQAIFAASQRALFVDKGAVNYTMTSDDVGKVLCFDTTAAARTLTLLLHSAAGIGHGFYFYVMPYGSATNGVTVTPAAPDTTDLSTSPPGRMTLFQWDGAKSVWRSDYVAPPTATPAPAFAGVRQTVASGPIDTSGLPTFLPSTAGTLNLTTQNITGTAALIASAANGWSQANGEPVDVVGYATANITWAGLTASRAAGTPNFLYATIAGGVLTPQQTLLAPIYQEGGTPATAAGQITFNIGEMRAYLGNGSAAPQTNLVVFGEAATDGVSVISTVMYAYNARYQSAFTATLPAGATAVAKSHNIGVKPLVTDFVIECTTAEGNYAVGDQIHLVSLYSNLGTVYGEPPLSASQLLISIVASAGGGQPWNVGDKTTGAVVVLTLANWKYKLVARRGW